MLINQRRINKPVSPQSPDRGSPYNKDLKFLFFGKNYPDLNTGVFPTTVDATTAQSVFDGFGSGLSTDWNGSDEIIFPNNAEHQQLGSSTLFCLAKYDSFPSSFCSFMSISGVGETSATNYIDFIGLTNTKRLRSFWETGSGTNVLTDSDVLSINAGEWHLYTIVRDSGATTSSIRFYLDGVQIGSTATGKTNPSGGSSSQVRLGVDQGGAARYNGEIALLGKSGRAWSDHEVKQFANNPWQIFAQPVNVLSQTGTAGGAFTLTADSGSYSVTGTANSLLLDALLTGASGSYAYTGPAADLTSGYSLAANTGSYTYTGTANTLTRDGTLAADSGAYTYTGTDAALTFASAGNFTLTALTGVYSASGTNADLLRAATLGVDSGSYSYTGTSVDLALGYSLTAEGGSYSYTGTAVDFSQIYAIGAEPGDYSYNGAIVNLIFTGLAPDVPTATGVAVSGTLGDGVSFSATFGNGVIGAGSL